LPEEIKVVPENPPPYNTIPAKIIGIQPPKDKDKGKKGSSGNNRKAPDRNKTKTIPWEDPPGPEPTPHYKIMFENHRRL